MDSDVKLSEFALSKFIKVLERKISLYDYEACTEKPIKKYIKEKGANFDKEYVDQEYSFDDFEKENLYREGVKIYRKRRFRELQLGVEEYIPDKIVLGNCLISEKFTKARDVLETFIRNEGKRTMLDMILINLNVNTNVNNFLCKLEKDLCLLKNFLKKIELNNILLPDRIRFYLGNWSVIATCFLKKHSFTLNRYKYYSSAPIHFDAFEYFVNYCKILEFDFGLKTAQLVLTEKEIKTIFKNIEVYADYRSYVLNFDKFIHRTFIQSLMTIMNSTQLINKVIEKVFKLSYKSLTMFLEKTKYKNIVIKNLKLCIIKELYTNFVNYFFEEFTSIFLDDIGLYKINQVLNKIKEKDLLKKDESHKKQDLEADVEETKEENKNEKESSNKKEKENKEKGKENKNKKKKKNKTKIKICIEI